MHPAVLGEPRQAVQRLPMRRAWALAVATLVGTIMSPTVAAVQAPAPTAPSPNLESVFRVGLAVSIEARILRVALARAMRRLMNSQCQTILSEFHDARGRPLAETLARQGIDAPRYLALILFRDAPLRYCYGSALAVTVPGSRVVHVCGRSFERSWRHDDGYAEAVLIHEMLHSLGLGENPPSSDEITRRVWLRCVRRVSLNAPAPDRLSAEPRP